MTNVDALYPPSSFEKHQTINNLITKEKKEEKKSPKRRQIPQEKPRQNVNFEEFNKDPFTTHNTVASPNTLIYKTHR